MSSIFRASTKYGQVPHSTESGTYIWTRCPRGYAEKSDIFGMQMNKYKNFEESHENRITWLFRRPIHKE